MTPDQQLAALTAAFLRSARGLAGFGWLLCLLAGLAALEAAMHGDSVALLLHGLALTAGFALAWQSLRMRFDIAAFELIARDDGAALANFDLALKRLGLRDGTDSRGLEQRAAATRKMVSRLALIVLLEFLFVAAGLFARHA
ncbi:hypothetical protein [Viridibacterium curvum]|uniref:Uncharacterized protein n=1 Tax=Viridibacterium curvum TaxID=1101404 RepID=A0ABP9QRV7_9RHOO